MDFLGIRQLKRLSLVVHQLDGSIAFDVHSSPFQSHQFCLLEVDNAKKLHPTQCQSQLNVL